MRQTSLALALGAVFVSSVCAETLPEFVGETIVVTPTRTATAVRESVSDVSVLDSHDLQRQDHIPFPDLLNALPGVQVTTSGGRGDVAAVFLRGGNSAHTAVLVDGIRISAATTGVTAFQAIPMAQVGRLEVVRGPVSSLYGTDAMSGLVQIFTPEGRGKPAPTAYVGAGSHGTVIASAGYGGEVGGTRFNILAGMERSDGFSTIKEAKGGMFDMYNADRDGYSNRNASAKVSHWLSRDLEVGAGAFYTRSTKHYDATNCGGTTTFTCTADFDNRNLQKLQSIQAHVDYQVNDIWNTSLRVGQGLDYSRNWLLDPSTLEVTRDHYETRQDQVTLQNTFMAWGGQLTLTGEKRVLNVDSSKHFVVAEQESEALSLGYQARYGDHVFQTSGRRDHISGLGSHNSAFFGYGYWFSPAWSARASYGTAFHAPSFNDLYWPQDFANFFEGNPDLKPERARNHEIGLKYDASGVRVGVTAYRNKISDLIDYRAPTAAPWLGTVDNLNSATITGLTLDYAVTKGNWLWRGNIDYLRAKDDSTGNTLQRRAPRTANLEVRRAYGLFDVGGRIKAVSALFNDRANTQKLAGYAMFDLDATYRITKSLILNARIDNVFDKDYTLVRSTLAPYNDYAVPGRTFFIGLRHLAE